MNFFFAIALLCASLCSFSQHHPIDTRDVNKCGFSSKADAEHGSVLARIQNSFDNPDEIPCDGSAYQGSDGSWCYSITYACMPRLNKEQVPDVAKIISQAQVDCAMIPYERSSITNLAAISRN